jgi:hypothetical protein
METKMILKKKSQISDEKQSEVKLNFINKVDLINKSILKEKPILHKKSAIELLKEDPNFEKISMSQFNFDFVKEMKPRTQIWDPNPEEVQEAYNKLKQMWNKDQKARNFVKHLVSAFLPYNQWNRLMNVSEKLENSPIKIDDNDLKKPFKCAILNHNVTGIGNISTEQSEYSMKRMFIDAHMICEDTIEGQEKRTQYNNEEIKTLNDLRNKQSVEVKNCRIGVMSDTSDKYLQVESIIALQNFTIELAFVSDELNFTIRKNMINRAQENVLKEIKLDKKQVNQIVARQIHGLDHKVDEKTYSALEKLKLELEKEDKKKKEN